ncbi:MAG: hypothetical protein G01um10143_785 [Parcubacteria group bacterium Gr01-1014_3]|nr:MAG: hypothetical protein G01um10143_785 [Parcubacteria group bacterium Gr01-1014_3]
MIINNKKLIGKSAEDWTEKLWLKLIEKVSQTNNEEATRKLIEHLLSADEKKMIAKRLGVIALIKSDKSYKEISEILWLSPNTISTIKKNILGNDGNYKSYRKFYGGPKKWSADIKYEKPFWEDFNLLEFIDDLLPRYRGIGLLSSPDVAANHTYRRRRK